LYKHFLGPWNLFLKIVVRLGCSSLAEHILIMHPTLGSIPRNKIKETKKDNHLFGIVLSSLRAVTMLDCDFKIIWWKVHHSLEMSKTCSLLDDIVLKIISTGL
jgi:hypothetical protein